MRPRQRPRPLRESVSSRGRLRRAARLGALGVTLIYAVLRFSNFAHGDLMAFGTMAVILVTWGLQALGVSHRAAADGALRASFGILAIGRLRS